MTNEQTPITISPRKNHSQKGDRSWGTSGSRNSVRLRGGMPQQMARTAQVRLLVTGPQITNYLKGRTDLLEATTKVPGHLATRSRAHRISHQIFKPARLPVPCCTGQPWLLSIDVQLLYKLKLLTKLLSSLCLW